MPSWFNTILHTSHRHFRIWQSQKEQHSAISSRLHVRQQLDVRPARERCFKPEVRPFPSELTNPFQQQPSGSQVLCFRGEWRQPRGDQVRIQEHLALHEVRQEFRSKRRFTRPIGTGDHVNRWRPALLLPQFSLLSSFGSSVPVVPRIGDQNCFGTKRTVCRDRLTANSLPFGLVVRTSRHHGGEQVFALGLVAVPAWLQVPSNVSPSPIGLVRAVAGKQEPGDAAHSSGSSGSSRESRTGDGCVPCPLAGNGITRILESHSKFTVRMLTNIR